MDIIIKSSLQTLKKSKALLDNLTDDTFSNKSVSPYYSSIGTHIRHILDFYDCIFRLNLENKIDLTARSRNKEVETVCSGAKKYLDSIMDRLMNFELDMKDLFWLLMIWV